MHHRSVAGLAEDQASQQRAVPITDLGPARSAIVLEMGLHFAEGLIRDDRFMLTVVDLGLVLDLPYIQRIRQERVQASLIEGMSSVRSKKSAGPYLRAYSTLALRRNP